MKITPENIDEYYNKINDFIDEYFKYNISATKLKNYLKRGSYGMKKFIERNDLEDIDNIEKIIIDVVEDRVAEQEEGILTFEKYTNSPDKYKELLPTHKPDDIEYKKILADTFKTSLSHIQNVESNLYKLTQIKNNIKVFIINKEELNLFTIKLSKFCYDYLVKENLEIKSLNINIPLEPLIKDYHAFKPLISKSDLEYFKRCLLVNYYYKFELLKEYNNHYILIMKEKE